MRYVKVVAFAISGAAVIQVVASEPQALLIGIVTIGCVVGWRVRVLIRPRPMGPGGRSDLPKAKK